MRDSQISSDRNLEWHNITTKCALEVLRVCLREDQADVTHAISPISLKFPQMIKDIKLFKSPKKFGLPTNPWGIRAFSSNPRDKIPKLALKFHFQQRFLTITEFSEY